MRTTSIAQNQTAIAPAAHVASNTGLFHRIWPAGVIIFGFILTALWSLLLGYGLIGLVSIAF